MVAAFELQYCRGPVRRRVGKRVVQRFMMTKSNCDANILLRWVVNKDIVGLVCGEKTEESHMAII